MKQLPLLLRKKTLKITAQTFLTAPDLIRNPVYMFLQDVDRYDNCRLTHLPADESRFTEINNSVNDSFYWLVEIIFVM